MNRREFVKTTAQMSGGVVAFPSFYSHFSSLEPSTVIQPEWHRSGTPLKHSWAGLGNIDQMQWVLRRDVQEHLAMAKSDLGLRHVRAVGMFDQPFWVYDRNPANFGNADRQDERRTNWRVVDYAFDSLQSIGLNPVLTLCFTPIGLASGTQTVFDTRSNITPPKDWKEWERLVGDCVRHCLERFGPTVVRNWYVEVWNEPNLSGFWTGGQQGYWELYKRVYSTVKSIEPTLKIGGPSSARGEWVREMLEFGSQNNCLPDYVISHCYNNDNIGTGAPLSPFEGPKQDRETKSPSFTVGVVKGIRKIIRDFGYKGEFHMNEWGLSWHPFNPVRETANEAAFIVKTMNEVSQVADYFAYWCLSDVYNQMGYGREAFHGNYGMISLDGLKKPAYFTHELLNRLGDQQVSVQGKGLNESVNAFASRSKQGIQVFAYRFDIEYEVGMMVRKYRTEIELPPEIDPSTLKLFKIDSQNNNLINQWHAIGSPTYLSKNEKESLLAGNFLTNSQEFKLEKLANCYRLSMDMEGPSVAFVESQLSQS